MSTYGLSFVGRFVLDLSECPLLEVSRILWISSTRKKILQVGVALLIAR